MIPVVLVGVADVIEPEKDPLCAKVASPVPSSKVPAPDKVLKVIVSLLRFKIAPDAIVKAEFVPKAVLLPEIKVPATTDVTPGCVMLL